MSTTGRTNLVSTPENAQIAAARARRYRAEWLLAVAEGFTSPLDLVSHAATNQGRPLRRIRLSELVGTQPGWGAGRVRKTMGGLLHQLAVHGQSQSPTTRLTVGWILDPRSNGRRFDSLIHALTPRQTPWTGFPFEPQPAKTLGGDWA